MKYQRHLKILELVQTEAIETQEQLMSRLSDSGFLVTQATVSRDIKELRLFKRSDRTGRSRYDVENSTAELVAQPERYQSILKDSIRAVDYAGNIVVVKSYTGMAQAVCAAIDAMRIESVVGSIAGDDTIFLAIRSEESARKLIFDLNKIFQ